MIEKLDRLQGRNIYENTALAKINEIIDVVNILIKENNIHEEQIDELQMKDEDLAERINYTLAKVTDDKEVLKQLDEKYKPADPFAEQRKWIGKLCKFWDKDKEKNSFTVLGAIENGMYYTEDCEIFLNCEPVKPDDDVIYKGE
ncbi:MAG: hypothetical protein MJ156_00335 [Alphaproteobacteria bacterium]|nr:hypothetical protein [Alphaproteobacteria bacterium]